MVQCCCDAMVHVPFLKVDLPEPRLQEILPGLVHFAVITCTHAFDAVHDFLRPLSTEQKAEVYMKSITHLPREFRLARKKLVENGVEDEDKMSEELEDAAFAFYRCDACALRSFLDFTPFEMLHCIASGRRPVLQRGGCV